MTVARAVYSAILSLAYTAIALTDERLAQALVVPFVALLLLSILPTPWDHHARRPPRRPR